MLVKFWKERKKKENTRLGKREREFFPVKLTLHLSYTVSRNDVFTNAMNKREREREKIFLRVGNPFIRTKKGWERDGKEMKN